jgi:thiosulfate sulfurtransferase
MATFKNLAISDAAQFIAEKKPVILDCRDVKDYRAGHLENAMHLHEKLRDSLIQKGEKEQPFLIYCYHGHASEHVAEMFSDFGFKEVYSLNEGYTGWQARHKL